MAEVRDVREIGRKFAEGNEALARKIIKIAEDWFVLEPQPNGFPQANYVRWAALILRGVLDYKSHYTPTANSKHNLNKETFFKEHGLLDDDCAMLFCEGIKDYFLNPFNTAVRAQELLAECSAALTEGTVQDCGPDALIAKFEELIATSKSLIENVRTLT